MLILTFVITLRNMLKEFQPVILAAGKGSRITELTENKPKCLLPIGGKPMVWYPLIKLENSGFSDVILLVYENQKAEIQNNLEKLELTIKIEYVPIPPNEDFGTADSLRFLNDKLNITADLLVLSCDLITDTSLIRVVDLYRRHEAAICVLLFQPQELEKGFLVPGPKSKYKPEKDIFGLDPKTNRIIFLASASDFETDVPLKRALLSKHRQILAYSNLVDSHVYIIKNWILKYLKHEESISTIKGELLPHIIKRQLYKQKKCSDMDVSVVNTQDANDIFHFSKENDIYHLIRNNATYNDHSGDLKPTYHGDTIRCYAHIAPNNVFGLRVNTLQNYWLINKEIIDRWPRIINDKLELIKIDPKAEIKSNQVDEKCIIWESAKLSEKTSFKNANIGANTEVSSFSRVFNSIVMNNVTIKEKVAIENCIICDGAIIESGSKLKGCIVGYNHKVLEGSEVMNEVLMDSDRLMEL
ncbi:translation initiation factor eIF2B subunit gamma [Onthophagus taurus]|uniref:translation initiation factor eIF2B subunit gamma n=1 Tax=Onthophagus taurus TaxID=166361 RepID=UPI000C20F9F5|nr:translation initiation factor eIF-2B subunit gamma [Onthophagus taurus]